MEFFDWTLSLTLEQRLFLDVDEALRSDFRSSSLATLRSSFCSIVQQRIRGPNDEYKPEGETNGTTPRPESNSYRLPPLSFGAGDNSNNNVPVKANTPPEPRSLTPITERTDIASRNPSTKTDKSQFFMSDSPGQHRQVTKQASGGSSKHANSSVGGDERLATITDSNESANANGQVTEEPASLDRAQPERSNTGDSSILQPTPTTHESAATTWSQSTGNTGNTPGQAVRSPAREETESEAFDTPQPADTSTLPSSAERDLPDLPGGWKPSQDQPSAIGGATGAATSDEASRARLTSVGAVPPLAAALPSPTRSRDTDVLSPTPRRGSVDPNIHSHNGGYEQAAAAYLANVVESRGQSKDISPPAGHTPLDMGSDRKVSDEKPRPTIITQLDADRRPSLQNDLGRRPSGARPLPVKTDSAPSSRILKSTPEDLKVLGNKDQHLQPGPASRSDRLASATSIPDLGEDAANFMAYADQMSPVKPTVPLKSATAAGPTASNVEDEMRSSFAPSKAATERKVKAEQAVADQQMAKTMPGAGKRTADAGQTWSDESDEEEKDEESEDEDAREKGQTPDHAEISGLPVSGGRPESQNVASIQSVQRVLSQTRALPAIPRSGLNGDNSGSSGSAPNSGSRRDFAPISEDTEYAPLSASALNERDQRDTARSRSPAAPLPQPPTIYPQQQQQQSYTQQQQPYAQQQQSYAQQQQQQQPAASRQTIWNANFAADHGLDPSTRSGKFVDIDEPAHLTKAFAPHGLLQAGMQDKEDRSAKKQEELARELGSSLVHVPEKPPPPQTGLLGAVAQHERERQGAGGIGAAITDRDRDRRLAVSGFSFLSFLPSPLPPFLSSWVRVRRLCL